MNKTFLLIILATVCNTASAWSLFGPKNYEDCVLEGLKGIPNNDNAVSMVRQACKKKFPAEYKPPTTPQEIADHNKNFAELTAKIKHDGKLETNLPTLEDLKDVEASPLTPALKAKFEHIIANRKALSKVSIVKWGIQCGDQYRCWQKIITATVKNNSKYVVDSLKVGWVLSSGQVDCNAALSDSASSQIRILPGQKATLSWGTFDGPVSAVNGCLGITQVYTE